jgi:hypothetical protein
MSFVKWTQNRDLQENMSNNYTPDMPIQEKINQYRRLAIEYYQHAESCKPCNPAIFSYLHSVELLLKLKVLEQNGDMALELEKSHDLGKFMKLLGVYNDETAPLAEVDPFMVRFRYPGKHVDNESSYEVVKDISRKLWRKFG